MSIIIFLCIITANFPVDIHVPAMPVIAEQLGMSVSHTQWMVSLFLLGYGVFPLLFGSLSDAIGRKRVLLSAMVVLMLGALMACVTTIPWVLLLSRFIQGAGASACISIPRAIMRDLYHGEAMARIASLIGVAVELSLAFSPVVGGYLVKHFGWHSNFVFILLLAIAVFLVVAWFYRETNASLQPHLLQPSHLVPEVWRVISHKVFMGYVLCSAAAFSSGMAFFTVSPFLIQDNLGYGPEIYGQLSLIATGAIVCGSIVNAIMVRRIGVSVMVRFGLGMLFVAGILMIGCYASFGLSLWSYLAPVVVAFFALAFMFGNCMSGALYPFPNQAGIAGSLYSTVQVCTGFAISSIVSVAPHDNPYLLGVIFMLTSGLAAISFLSMRPDRMSGY